MTTGGNGHRRAMHFHKPPERVVSLVPSLTESMFDLGLGDSLVGISDYCTYPAEGTARLPRLGGPKNPHVDEILALQPDLVMANMEENTRQGVEALEAGGVFVWVTFPRSVAGALEVLWTLAGLFQSQAARLRIQTLELTLDWAVSAAAGRSRVRYFCPIWFEETSAGQPWWMTFNRNTYCHDLLHHIGGENVFAERVRSYPLEADLGNAPAQEAGERDTRYPRLALPEVLAARPEAIFLPNEPYGFSEEHRLRFIDLLKATPAVQTGCIYTVEGSLLTWHGTRLARALRELPELLDLCRSA